MWRPPQFPVAATPRTRMPARTAAAIGSLLFLLAFLAGALRIYDAQQHAIALEGNRLYSTDSFTVTRDARHVLEAIREKAPDARVLKDLADGGRTRAVLAADLSDFDIPVYEGRRFSAEAVGEAIVGADVPVDTRAGRAYVSFDGRDYVVVGRLGLDAESLLAEDTLLSDPALFGVLEETIVVDGPQARDAYVEAFGDDGMTSTARGTTHRTNVDIVSRLILTYGASIVLAGLAYCGVLAHGLLRPYLQTLHILGRSAGRILATPIAWLGALWVLAVGLASLVWWLLPVRPAPGTALPATDLALLTAAVGVPFTVACMTTVARFRKPGNQWN